MASKKPANPVTLPARDAFMLYMRSWQDRLGLCDWRIVLSLKQAPKANMADVDAQYEHRLARVRLGPDFGSLPVDDRNLEEVALHELLHVFLNPLLECSRDSDVPDDVVASEEHRVINTLVRLLIESGGNS